MVALQWSTSHAVFVAEIDDEHKEIFEAVAKLHAALDSNGPLPEVRKLTERLVSSIVGHFAHEERLMRAARYDSFPWHKQRHEAARRRVGQYALRIAQGDAGAGMELVEHLTSWLPEHAGLADRMMGAFLRNHRRGMFKVTFRAGTKPLEACTWVDVRGDTFDPRTSEKGS